MVFKSANRHLEYVPRCFKNQMWKKVEHKLISKKKTTDIQTDTQNEKVQKWFISYYYLTVKVEKNNGTSLFWCQIMYQT